MSISTIERPQAQGGDDGSGNIVDWEQWRAEVARQEEKGFTVQDVGKRALLGANMSMPGFAPEFQTDRIMPRRHHVPQYLGKMTLPAAQIG